MARYDAEVAQSMAECGATCMGEAHDDGNAAKTVYSGTSKGHLTPGELASVGQIVTIGEQNLADGWGDDVNGGADDGNGDVDWIVGEIAYAAELWATAAGKYAQASIHYNAAIVHYWDAEQSYEAFGESYGEAANYVGEAEVSEDCLECFEEDGNCICE
jgi:hypothetical protein